MAADARPLPKVHVGMHQGRPTLFWDGEPYFYTAYWPRHVPRTGAQDGSQTAADREDYIRRAAEIYH